MKELKILNEIYTKLHDDKNRVIAYLEELGYPYQVAYYPHHSFKKDNEFYLEEYPIPVITLNGLLDIGIDVDKIFFEFRLDKEMALEFDFHIFEMYQFEVYGVDDFYDDFYFDNIDEIHSNILSSEETFVGISIIISKEDIEEKTDQILNLITHLM